MLRCTEMGKPDGHPLEEKKIIRFSKLSGSSSEPVNRNHAIHSGLTSAKAKLEVQDNNRDSANKRKLNKINIKAEPYAEGNSTFPFQQLPNHRLTPKSEHGRGPYLILMSCLSCRIHVMVSNVNPECPKCSKGDCLLDMYRGSPVKKARIYM